MGVSVDTSEIRRQYPFHDFVGALGVPAAMILGCLQDGVVPHLLGVFSRNHLFHLVEMAVGLPQSRVSGRIRSPRPALPSIRRLDSTSRSVQVSRERDPAFRPAFVPTAVRRKNSECRRNSNPCQLSRTESDLEPHAKFDAWA